MITKSNGIPIKILHHEFARTKPKLSSEILIRKQLRYLRNIAYHVIWLHKRAVFAIKQRRLDAINSRGHDPATRCTSLQAYKAKPFNIIFDRNIGHKKE